MIYFLCFLVDLLLLLVDLLLVDALLMDLLLADVRLVYVFWRALD